MLLFNEQSHLINRTFDYLGTSLERSAPVAAAGASAGAPGTAEAPGTSTTGALSITPPSTCAGRFVTNARPSVAAKKMTAARPVIFDKKLEEPVAPNRLP